jgi:hypothetical protein
MTKLTGKVRVARRRRRTRTPSLPDPRARDARSAGKGKKPTTTFADWIDAPRLRPGSRR